MRLFIKHDSSRPEELKYAIYTLLAFFERSPQSMLREHKTRKESKYGREAVFFGGVDREANNAATKRIADFLKARGLSRHERWDADKSQWLQSMPNTYFVEEEANFYDILNNTIENEPDNPALFIDSNMLIPQMLLQNELLPYAAQKKDISVPIITYKYTFQEIVFNEQSIMCKFFIASDDLFFDLSGHGIPRAAPLEELSHGGRFAFIPGEDERYNITQELWNKLAEAGRGGFANLPFLSPSPYIHGWENMHDLVLRNPVGSRDAIDMRNHACVMHKFELVKNRNDQPWRIE